MAHRTNCWGGGSVSREDLRQKCIDPYHCDVLASLGIGLVMVARVICVAGTATYDTLFPKGTTWRLISAWVVMTGAGAGGDTVKISNPDGDVTDTKDVSALGDEDLSPFAHIGNALEFDVNHKMIVTTASDATCEVYAMLARTA